MGKGEGSPHQGPAEVPRGGAPPGSQRRIQAQSAEPSGGRARLRWRPLGASFKATCGPAYKTPPGLPTVGAGWFLNSARPPAARPLRAFSRRKWGPGPVPRGARAPYLYGLAVAGMLEG